MTVAAKILTYPHHSDELPRFTTSPVKNMHPLIQTQSCHTAEVLEKCPADWFADASLLVLLRRMMMTPQLIRLHLHPVQCQQSPSKCTLHIYITLEAEEEDMKEDFQTVPLDDEHWDMEEIPDRTLCVHEHAIPHRLCPYPCPYVNYQTSSYYDTLDISDISEFKDIMTMSSDDDISPLEDTGY